MIIYAPSPIKTLAFYLVLLILFVLMATAGAAPVAAGARVVRETAEMVLKQSGKRASREMLEQTVRQLDAIALRCGPESIAVIRKHGSAAYRLFKEVGEEAGPDLVRTLQRYGDDALRIGQTAAGRRVLINGSSDAIRAVARHSDAVIPLIQRHGEDGARALSQVNAQNGRRLVHLANSRTFPEQNLHELMGVVERHGDRAMDFIWRNKGALAVGATLVTFNRNPQPFIDGTAILVESGFKAVVRTVATAVQTAASKVRWNLWIPVVIGLFGLKFISRRRARPAASHAAVAAEVIEQERRD